MTVGIVIVSHSPKVAEGTADMVRQMVGTMVPLAWCGGDGQGGLGSDVGAILRAIEAAWSDVALLARSRADDEIEMGVGIHGEPGRRRQALAPADSLAAELLGSVLEDLRPVRGSEVLLLVKGVGGTPLLELYGMVSAAHRVLDAAAVTVARHLTGSFVTSLEMAGCSLSLTLLDASITPLWDAPVQTAALHWGR